MGSTDTYRSTLLFACLLSGGEAKLARRLGVPIEDVLRWLFGEEDPPLELFLSAVDIVLNERAGTLAETRKMLRISKEMVQRTRERQAKHARQAGSTKPRALRVLVVDDEPDTVDMLLALLGTAGHTAKGFHDASEALAAVHAFKPHAAILDVSMPGMSGLDLAREIRQAMGEACPLLVGVSGQFTREADKAIARDAGFDHYFPKPCDPAALLALLGTMAAERKRC